MAGPTYPTPDILARRRYLNNPTTVSLSTANASSTLTHGVWLITSDVDCFFLQGQAGVVSAGTSGTVSIPLWSRSYAEVYVSADPAGVDTGIAAAVTSGTGTLYCFKAS